MIVRVHLHHDRSMRRRLKPIDEARGLGVEKNKQHAAPANGGGT